MPAPLGMRLLFQVGKQAVTALESMFLLGQVDYMPEFPQEFLRMPGEQVEIRRWAWCLRVDRPEEQVGLGLRAVEIGQDRRWAWLSIPKKGWCVKIKNKNPVIRLG